MEDKNNREDEPIDPSKKESIDPSMEPPPPDDDDEEPPPPGDDDEEPPPPGDDDEEPPPPGDDDEEPLLPEPLPPESFLLEGFSSDDEADQDYTDPSSNYFAEDELSLEEATSTPSFFSTDDISPDDPSSKPFAPDELPLDQPSTSAGVESLHAHRVRHRRTRPSDSLSESAAKRANTQWELPSTSAAMTTPMRVAIPEIFLTAQPTVGGVSPNFRIGPNPIGPNLISPNPISPRTMANGILWFDAISCYAMLGILSSTLLFIALRHRLRRLLQFLMAWQYNFRRFENPDDDQDDEGNQGNANPGGADIEMVEMMPV